MKRIAYDLETDGLLHELTKIHCVSLMDLDDPSKTPLLYHDTPGIEPCHGDIREAMDILDQAEHVVAHNNLGFDNEVVKKLYGVELAVDKCFDTIVASRVVFSDLRDRDFARRDADPEFPGKFTGSHALGAWGYRLGEAKGDYDGGWSTFNQDMATYALQDVVVTEKLYRYLLDRLPEPKPMGPMELEMQFAAICEEMNRTGVQIDRPALQVLLETLEGRLADLESEIQSLFPPEYHEYKPYPSGKPRMMFCKVRNGKFADKRIPFDPGSRQQLARRLEAKYGWSPTSLSSKGNPVMNEEVLMDLADRYDEVKPVAEYYIVKARLGTLREGQSSYVKLMDSTGILRGRTIHIGTQTGRCAHRSPNLGNICSSRAPYGHEIRSLFIPRRGYIQAGFDASALEFVALAHYVGKWDGGALRETVLSGNKDDGTDIHSMNAKNIEATGVPCTRAMAKTAIYCTMYGGSARRLAEQLGCKVGQARKIQKALTGGIKGLNELQASLIDAVEKRGAIWAINGMRVGTRSPHSALNFLLQSCGAMVMKAVTVFVKEEVEAAGMVWGKDYILTGHVHDELQGSLKEEFKDSFSACVDRAFERTTDLFQLRCPVAGETDFGSSWAQTH